MTDPLAEVVNLLQPAFRASKLVSAAGSWAVRRTDMGQPFYCTVLDGRCRLLVPGQAPLLLTRDDFVLLPAAHEFTVTSLQPPPADRGDVVPDVIDGQVRLGDRDGAPDVQLLVGHCALRAPDAALMTAVLPALIHIPAATRLSALVRLVSEEARAQRAGRELVLARLLEVLFIEALRADGAGAPAGLARGLSDPRLAAALRELHAWPAAPWTVAALAKAAALSRSAFFERFQRAVGVPPMEYLLAWRMATAKSLLLAGRDSLARVAEQVGYGSASAFSVAFARQAGEPPATWAARQRRADGQDRSAERDAA